MFVVFDGCDGLGISSWMAERIVVFEIGELAGEIDNDRILGIALETKRVFLVVAFLGIRTQPLKYVFPLGCVTDDSDESCALNEKAAYGPVPQIVALHKNVARVDADGRSV